MPVLVEYVSGNTLLHKLNPITKVMWSFAVVISCFMTEKPSLILSIFLINLAIAVYAKVFRHVFPVIKGLLIFSLFLILFQIFFVSDGRILFYAVPFLNIGRVTDLGLKLSIILVLRMLAMMSTIPVILTTTRMTDIVIVMVETLRVPYKYAFMLTTVLRFIPLYSSEMHQILQAQMSRGMHSDTRNPFGKFAIMVPLAIPLLAASIKKAEKMAISMEVRGFGSGPRSHLREVRMLLTDYIVLGILLLITATAVTAVII